jgi:hypothetical protein
MGQFFPVIVACPGCELIPGTRTFNRIPDSTENPAPRPRDHALAGDGILRCLGLRSFGPTAVSASIISRFGLRFVGSSVASSAASGDGPLGARERGKLRRAFNDFRRLTSSRREHGLDYLNRALDLLVRHRLDSPRMFDFHIPRAQQCQQLAVSGGLVLAHLGNCRWTAVPEVSQQRRDELAIQLLTMTRANRTAGRVSNKGAHYPKFRSAAVSSCTCYYEKLAA